MPRDKWLSADASHGSVIHNKCTFFTRKNIDVWAHVFTSKSVYLALAMQGHSDDD